MQNKNKTNVANETRMYRFMRFLAKIANVLYRIKYHGIEIFDNLQTPYILISNHRSCIDPLVIASCIKKNHVSFLGKKELASSKIGNYIFSKLYMIPIDRKNTDLRAMKKAIKLIKSGGILGIFPEGTRHKSGDMQEAENGVGVIIQMCNVPVVPIYIDRKFKLFRKTNIYIFEPLDFSEIVNSDADVNKNELIMEEIKDYYKKVVKTYQRV